MLAAETAAGLRRLASSGVAWAALALVGLRLWLGGGLAVYALPNAGRDDAMFLALAGEIAAGRWLGDFDCLTLAKVPLYPAFLAGTLRAGVPLLPTQQVLHVLACAAFVVAVAPALPSRWARLGLLAGLLFQPGAAAAPVVTRVAREGIYPSLTLLVLAAAAWTALRCDGGRRALVGGALSGLALAALWLTREEGVWILPAVGVVAALPWVAGPRPRPAAWGLALAAGLATFAAGWCAVASLNAERYGAFTVSEPGLARAYGALTRVEHRTFRRYLPVPAETRWRLYAVSPTFARLAPLLDGPVGQFWAASSCPGVGVCDDVGGGWFTWALRDAAQAAGACATGESAERFWGAVADEVDGACAAGWLRCGPSRASMAEPWRAAYAGPVLAASGRALGQLAWPRGLPAWLGPSPLDERAPSYALLAGQPFAAEAGLRVRALDAVAAAWGPLQALAAGLGGLAFLATGLASARRRTRPPAAWALAAAMLAAVGARAVVLAYVDVTSFPAVGPLYLAPAYPLVVAFAVLALAGAAARRP